MVWNEASGQIDYCREQPWRFSLMDCRQMVVYQKGRMWTIQ